ncbi:2-hydroxyacid dehydrogenase [Salinarimonas soli]|uniref:Glyoxylate/hydroxypyruvate reductase A n=1 Tax=Salinarimonas soli TaxID=1638099 RepID=A0A5B2VAU0_9HYPH|nr:glyoxylate/hydroxypyruvate reductase A [Salinarimonas soli]KAA2236131.1 glyoxylate/hydroxypyruvate reductase A [Salinarimonas soli]
MTLLVAITGWEVAPWVERFRRLLPDRRVVALGEPYEPDEILYAAAWKHPPGTFAGLPNLRAIFSLGAGVDHLVGDPALPDVPVVRVVDEDLTNRMSEYVVLHCLAHLRQARLYDGLQRERRWWDDRHQPAARDVRVGVMGLGVLGLDAARKLQVMGFDVAGWSRSPKSVEGLPTFAGETGLDAFLARTDILVCLLPLTPDTRGILRESLLTRLARDGRLGGPVLVNAGRGGLQVEADILRCLDAGVLKAATLDVFETEPLPAASPLWGHPAVTVTPHNAAMSAPDAVGAQVADGIFTMESGMPLRHRVDPARGY